MPDYSKGKIYKIVNDVNDKIYIGSTTRSLDERKWEHHSDSRYKSNKLYNDIRNICLSHFEIELIEEYSCDSRKKLLDRERYWICKLDTIKSGYNSELPGTTKKQSDKNYRENNKEKIAKQNKQYYEKNKDKVLVQCEIYRNNNKEKIYETQKEYRKNNKDLIIEKKKLYREKNKDKIKVTKSRKVVCDCGSVVSNDNLSRHYKTNKHKKLIYTSSSPSYKSSNSSDELS